MAGVGDLMLTCHGSLSRNRHVGFELGKGQAIDEILGKMTSIAEGIGTTPAVLALAGEHHVEMPITEQVNAVLRRLEVSGRGHSGRSGTPPESRVNGLAVDR